LKNRRSSRWTVVAFAGLVASTPHLSADSHVTVTANATPAYLQRKFAGPEPVAESYVFMKGQYHDGVTRDHSIERMDFRQIAEFLALQLARSKYFPTRDPKTADLLLVVHWGTTKPRFTSDVQTSYPTASVSPDSARSSLQMTDMIMSGETDLLGATSSFADNTNGVNLSQFDDSVELTEFVDRAQAEWSNAELLGYTKQLRQFSQKATPSTEDNMLRANLGEERYFVIVKAYDLHATVAPGHRRRAVWSVYMNIRSPGNNFPTALNLMGLAASGYFGHDTNGVQTVEPASRSSSVTLAPLIILGEAK